MSEQITPNKDTRKIPGYTYLIDIDPKDPFGANVKSTQTFPDGYLKKHVADTCNIPVDDLIIKNSLITSGNRSIYRKVPD